MSQLRKESQEIKYDMYKRLGRVLLGLLAAWFSMSMIVLLANQRYIHIPWQYEWMMHSYWHIAYYVVTFGICIIWRPSPAAQQYGYNYLQTIPDTID